MLVCVHHPKGGRVSKGRCGAREPASYIALCDARLFLLLRHSNLDL